MKNNIQMFALLLIFASSLIPLAAYTEGIPWYTPPKEGTDPTYDGATFDKLKAIKVNVHWENISLQAALDDLTSQSQQSDPNHKGIKFISKVPADNQKVNITLERASLEEILAYLSAQTKLGIKIHKDKVVFLPMKESTQPGQ